MGDPEKLFVLTTANVDDHTVAVILSTPTTSTSEEESATLENLNASNRFAILNEQASLNPLKPVVIANTEFVPIGTGDTSPDSTGLKAQFGEGNLISVNNVTKLFEIQRQIRDANLKNSEKLLMISKGYDSAGILKAIKKKMTEVFDEIIDEDIDVTITNFINAVKNNLTTNPRPPTETTAASTTSSTTAGGTGGAGQMAEITAASRTDAASAAETRRASQDFGLARSHDPELKKVNEANKNDPYYKTLIEYAAYEIILYEAIRYLSGILRLKNDLLRSWSILESTSFEAMYSIDTASLSSTAQEFISNSGVKNSYSTAGNSDRITGLMGITTTAETTDIALIMQTFVSAYDFILLKQGFHSSITKQSYLLKQSPRITTNAASPVRDALMELQKSWVTGLYMHSRSYKIPGGTATVGNYSHPSIFKDDNIASIKSKFPNEMTDSQIYGELLSACLFNDVFDIANYQAGASDKIFSSIDMGSPAGDVATGTMPITAYYRNLLGQVTYDDMTPGRNNDSAFVEYNPMGDPTSLGQLEDYLRVTQSAVEDFNYLAFESTQNYTGNKKYLTGPEYFVDIALQRGDQSFDNFDDFITKYKNVASSYIADADRRLKLFQVEPSFLALCAMIGDDLTDQATAYNNALLLRFSILVKLVKTDSGLVEAFRSAYIGTLDSGSPGSSDLASDAPGDPFGHGSGATSGVISNNNARRRLSRQLSNQILEDFLVGPLEVKKSGMRVKSKKEFRDLSGEKYKHLGVYEYAEKDKNFARISGTKTINTGTGESGSGSDYFISKQSGRDYDGDDGLNKEQYRLDRGIRYGENSLFDFLNNKHFKGTMFADSSARMDTFNDQRANMFTEGAMHEGHKFMKSRNPQGAIYSLSEHNRAFILFAFVAKILQKSLKIKAKSGGGGGDGTSNNAYIKLIGNREELQGVARAFKDAGEGQHSSNTERLYPENSDAWKTAYSNTKESINEVRMSIKQRKDTISQLIALPAIHALQLEKSKNAVKAYVPEGGGTKKSSAAINLLKNDHIKTFGDATSLMSEESVSEMFNSYVNTFAHKADTIFTLEDQTNYKQMKLMIKILTNPGYGFLSSEKRGNPVISHVGITNSMLSILRYDAYKQTGNAAFLESKRFCVNIFKRNEIDASEVVYPKTFLFDSKYQIHDYNEVGLPLNHITNYSDTWSFNDIVNNMVFTSWSDVVEGQEGQDPFNSLRESYRARRAEGSTMLSNSDVSKDLLINHINDYAIKAYYKYALGIDFETHSFVLKSSDINFSNPTGGFSSARSEIPQNYNDFINTLIASYPASNVDPVLASELFRAIKTIGATPVYSLGEKVKRVLLPKKFDRVLSIPFNDKDFILYTPAYDKEFEQIFKTTPNFSYTSRVSRTDFKYFGWQGTGGPTQQKSNVEKYRTTTQQDYPEIFATYVTITILPDGTK